MSLETFVNADASNLTTARCQSATDLGAIPFKAQAAGDQVLIDLYLTGKTGLQDLQSYGSVRLGLGPLNARPESGSYEMNGGTLQYDHDAATLSAAIFATTGSANTAIEVTPFVFKVTFGFPGAQTLPTIDAADLVPASSVNVARLVTGDGSIEEVWLWRIFRNPIALTTSWTNLGDNGLTGTLNLGTVGVYDLLGTSTTATTNIELELTDSSGNITTIMQQPYTINGETIGQGAAGVAEYETYATQSDLNSVLASSLQKANNLSDVASTSTSRTNLELGAFQDAGGTASINKLIVYMGDLAGFGNETSILLDDSAEKITIQGEVIITGGTTTDHVQFDTSATAVYSEGQMHWNSTDKTVEIDTGVDDVAIQIGQELLTPLVPNNTGLTITSGQVCRIDNTGAMVLAQADSTANSDGTIGVATHSIENGTSGFITTFGLVRGVDTSGLAVGDTIWLDASTAGAYTTVKPSFAIKLGVVWSVDAVDGSLLINVEDMRIVSSIPFFKNFTITTQGLGSGIFYAGGFYEFATSDSNLNEGGTTQNFGTANYSYAAHAFIVAGGAGAAAGGAGSVTITVKGTSITDAGVRTTSDTETIVADITTMTTNAYYESSKKWLGPVTFNLDSGATGHTTYSADFNYGLCKYDNLGNRDFNVTDFEVCGLGGSAESNADFTLFKHSSDGWTYAATGFEPEPTIICQLTTDHSTDDQWASGVHFAYKRTELSTPIEGTGSEGFLVRVNTSTNNSIEYANIHIGATI